MQVWTRYFSVDTPNRAESFDPIPRFLILNIITLLWIKALLLDVASKMKSASFTSFLCRIIVMR